MKKRCNRYRISNHPFHLDGFLFLQAESTRIFFVEFLITNISEMKIIA